MSELTKEWLLKTIAELEEERDAVPGVANEDAANALAAMKLALASLEAEPLGYIDAEYAELLKSGHIESCSVYAEQGEGCITLYIAPPAPVSVPTFEEWCERTEQKPVGWVRDAMKEAYDGCRAAMLQGADGKPELTVWYGAMPETNGKTNWTAMLHREGQHPWEGITIDRSEYPDRVRYEADRMRHLIGELADEPDILAYDADAHSGYVYPGNPPVIPDGWVLVPVEPTYQMCEAMGLPWESPRFPDRYKAMIAAAPQQEVNNG